MLGTREFIDTIREYERTESPDPELTIPFQFMGILLAGEVDPSWAYYCSEEIKFELNKYLYRPATPTLLQSIVHECEMIVIKHYRAIDLNKYPIIAYEGIKDSINVGFGLRLGDVVKLIDSYPVSVALNRALVAEVRGLYNKKEKRDYTNSDFSLFGPTVFSFCS